MCWWLVSFLGEGSNRAGTGDDHGVLVECLKVTESLLQDDVMFVLVVFLFFQCWNLWWIVSFCLPAFLQDHTQDRGDVCVYQPMETTSIRKNVVSYSFYFVDSPSQDATKLWLTTSNHFF